ncbi:MAG: discoidin domain-containing protein [Ketobacteraceae bacterium]|nr:discoidin domain-containing protein [Ketobacteraceae bacterium]
MRIIHQGHHYFSLTHLFRVLGVALFCTLLSGCIVSITSSSDDGHGAYNTTDNDLSPESRWSAWGEGEWIQYQLIYSIPISNVDIAFYRGDQRRAFFEIWLGDNPDSLTRVFRGESSGTTADFERFHFEEHNARYVRVVGYGNSENSWNSIAEVSLEGDIGNGGGSAGPEPVYRQSFESQALGSSWLGNSLASVQASCGVNNSRCLQVRYEPYSSGSRRLVKDIPIPPAREYTLQYDVKFDPGFEFIKGGKMHGLGPKYKTTGCKPIEEDGWSVRVMWRRNGRAEMYNYHQDRQHNCGDSRLADFYFNKSGYQAVSLYVRVNSASDRSDGETALFINGREVSRWDNIRLRSVINRDTEINRFLFSTFHGGADSSWSPSKTVYAYYDNFAIVPGLAVRQRPGEN